MNTKDREYMENLNNNLTRMFAKINEMSLTMAQLETNIKRATESINGWPRWDSELESMPRVESEESPETDVFQMKSSPKVRTLKKEQAPKESNKFVDDGSMHRDSVNQTPDIKVSAKGTRQRFKMIDQTCSRCSKTFEVHPQHARDSFTCDNCLRR